ncbi:hypothetical protein PanWU01x14_138660 [Parasponia andersonii]|uniref:Reverse transcriptase domain containing protein n=1 Tax=Parasponia andersonii TaxID=3476 RepID=A0A2P5CMT4_PARAD|nr:hypothetical protein PanWU01x14_138660 [Parasponia andersonii]
MGLPTVTFHTLVESGKMIFFLLYFFFCLIKDFLSHYLTHLFSTRAIDYISPPRGKSALTYFLYADGVLIFCRASPKNLRAVHSAFELYGSLSGRVFNWEKSNIYFGKRISPTKIRDLLSICGMK